ncbi:hypothetical protein NB636_10385 [Oxalobacter aliiformigenes]|uniref:BRO family protein n=1 Tax=Oxalobacter aliiformigenes TaxID=2946593 RepID=UPI0022AE976D|nr:BRO family protein [Oxalobacter aliiformigenes]MCZ4065389.1 hypothetical protein [Oxalobacter aliiformigenes]WAV99072.1 hypothetical protein NB636_10385 [Oxalobacter aliiformigenes]
MPKIKIAHYEGTPIHYVTPNRRVWFVTADILEVLELENETLKDVLPEQKAQIDVKIHGQKQRIDIIAFFGVLQLAARSKSGRVLSFTRWLAEGGRK